MKIKLDENLSRHLKPSLEILGHDVSTAAEEDLLGRDDAQVATAAHAEGRMLFTLDVKFADIRYYPPGAHSGFILFRPESFGPLAVNRFVEGFVRSSNLEELAGCIAVVEPAQVRVRRPPTPEETD